MKKNLNKNGNAEKKEPDSSVGNYHLNLEDYTYSEKLGYIKKNEVKNGE